MFQMLTIIIVIISIILSFVTHPAWGWLPIALVEIIICVQLWAAKHKYRFNYISNLSSEANDLLQRYGHFFASPFASKDFSASAATSQFAGIALAVIGIFRSFWWGVAFCAANWCVMGVVAVSLSPASKLAKNPALQIVHDEVIKFINSKRSIVDSTKESLQEIDEFKKWLPKETVFEIIAEVQKTVGGMLSDHEMKAIEEVISDCEAHYHWGPNMFSSTGDFHAFMDSEVKFHANISKLDFERAKETYIFWAKKCHSADYDHVVAGS